MYLESSIMMDLVLCTHKPPTLSVRPGIPYYHFFSFFFFFLVFSFGSKDKNIVLVNMASVLHRSHYSASAAILAETALESGEELAKLHLLLGSIYAVCLLSMFRGIRCVFHWCTRGPITQTTKVHLKMSCQCHHSDLYCDRLVYCGLSLHSLLWNFVGRTVYWQYNRVKEDGQGWLKQASNFNIFRARTLWPWSKPNFGGHQGQ